MGSNDLEEILWEIYKDDPPEYVTVKRSKLEVMEKILHDNYIDSFSRIKEVCYILEEVLR